MLLSGIIPAITTPFYADGQIYFKKLEHNVGRYSKTPVSGMVVLGSTGEATFLSDDEKRDVLKCAIENAAAEKVMVAGVGSESAIDTLRFSEYAAEIGYDVALVRTPFYYKGSMKAANLLAYYRFVADRSPLPVLLYNVPPFTQYDMPVELVVELAGHPNIIGLKESSGSIEKVQSMVEATKGVDRSATVTDRFEAVTGRMLRNATSARVGELVGVESLAATASPGSASAPTAKPSSAAVQVVGNLKTRQKKVGFQIVVGAAHKLHPSLKAGAVGAVLAFAACAPTACYEVFAAFKDNDDPLAAEKQDRISKAAERVSAQMSIPGTKYAMDLNGYYGGNGRLPLLPLTMEMKQEIESLMAKIKS
jgi:dihydrodipicolinate synthase/N-acetylneuraminate lyase